MPITKFSAIWISNGDVVYYKKGNELFRGNCTTDVPSVENCKRALRSIDYKEGFEDIVKKQLSDSKVTLGKAIAIARENSRGKNPEIVRLDAALVTEKTTLTQEETTLKNLTLEETTQTKKRDDLLKQLSAALEQLKVNPGDTTLLKTQKIYADELAKLAGPLSELSANRQKQADKVVNLQASLKGNQKIRDDLYKITEANPADLASLQAELNKTQTQINALETLKNKYLEGDKLFVPKQAIDEPGMQDLIGRIDGLMSDILMSYLKDFEGRYKSQYSSHDKYYPSVFIYLSIKNAKAITPQQLLTTDNFDVDVSGNQVSYTFKTNSFYYSGHKGPRTFNRFYPDYKIGGTRFRVFSGKSVTFDETVLLEEPIEDSVTGRVTYGYSCSGISIDKGSIFATLQRVKGNLTKYRTESGDAVPFVKVRN